MEAQLHEVGRTIHAALPGRSRHPLRALDQRAMELASQDAELRAALFRFVDVTPACRSLDDLARHLRGYLDEVDDRPPPIEAAMLMSGTKPGRAALGAAAAAGVRHMAHRFIVGESPRAALKAIRHLWDNGAAVSLDLLGEATVTEAEADRYAARCMDALETLAEAAPSWPERPVLEADSLGLLPRVNLSVKVSALTPLLRPEAPEVGREDAARRMRPLLVRAKELGAHLHIDMESVDTIEATMGLVFELLDEPELREGLSAGVVIQAYLRESPEQLERVLDWASASPRSTWNSTSRSARPSSRADASACATERRLCDAIAGRTCGQASIRRRVSASKLRSESRLSSNTGGVQPCWRASTTSWSQYAPFTSRTTSGCSRAVSSDQSSTWSSCCGDSRR